MLLNLGILENVDTTCADNFALVAQTYNNLGDIFYKATIFGKALTMYANSLGYACHLSDKTEESHARRGIWRCSYVMDLPCKDTAIANYASLLPRIKSAKEISSLYNNITGYFMYRGMLDSAFIYNGIAVLKSVDSLTLYRNYSVRSELFIEMQNYDSARYYAALALKSNDIYTRAASAFRLSHATEHENNDTSIYYLKYYGALLDSINNIKTSDSINTILYKKQLSSVQDTMSRSHAVMAAMAVVLVLAIGGLAMLFVKAAHGKNAMRREADSLKQRLSELNEELDTNRREAEAMQAKYTEIKEKETRFESYLCEDADYLIVAFGSAARISQKAIELCRNQGIKVGLLRPITLWPFPYKAIEELSNHVKGILSFEINAGQMIEDIRLAVAGKTPVEHFGRMGGVVPDPDEVVTAIKEKLIK